MFNKFILLIVAIVCITGVGYAQEKPCSTDEQYWKLVEKYPELQALQQQFDDQVSRRIAERTTSAAVDTVTYDIPIVIHVIHDYGNENLNDTILYQAAKYWTVVYMKQNADTSGVIPPFVSYIGKPNMRLHLATIDPNGKPTKGIVRFQSYLTQAADDEAKFGQWPPTEYVNIWFINAFGASATGAAAYAYFPSSAVFQPYYDGIICLASYANYAKTVPHEMGHVLNLYHPWGNSNSPGIACGDDQVDDTPPTKGHNPSGCVASALYDTACATGYMKHYVAAGGGDSVVNYPDTTNAQNIMDYTYCQEMFTKGQVVRMRAAIVSSVAGRNNLITPANLALTGALAPMPDLPPVADFIVNKGTGATSDFRSYYLTIGNTSQFAFRNASWNDTVSSVLWSFSNGATQPTSTSIGIVNNQFTVPGWVKVSLVATSNAGSDTLVNTQTVYAADTIAAGGIGYTQSFASAADIANWPMFNFYNNQFKWEFYTGTGMGDNTCLRYRSYDTSQRITGNAVGDHDDIYTPAFDLTGATGNVYLNFFSSGAYTHNGLPPGTVYVNDSIEIDASNTGGAQWAKIGGFGGNSGIADNGNYGYEYIPTSATAWKPRAIVVPVAYQTAKTFFRFRYHPGNAGNDLYIDNVSFSGFPAGIKEALTNEPNKFNIFPNPASNGFNIIFNTGIDGVIAYTIKDLTGKIVYENKKAFAPNSMEQESIPRSATPAAGMYFVTLTIDGVNMVQKLVVY